MSIIAISQTLGSLGDEIGRELARALGWDFADREILLKTADRFGEGLPALQHATDERPTLWERFTGATEPYRTYVEAIIWEMAARDDAVLVGRGAAFVLAPVRHVLRVRITAPESLRARRMETQHGLMPGAAREAVRRSDRDRAARIAFLYGVDWNYSLAYDLVLNTERLGLMEGLRTIQEFLRSEPFRPTADSRRQLADQSVTAAAKAALLAHPMTRPLPLVPTARDGRLAITGVVEHEEQRRAAEQAVERLPGVVAVANEIVILPRHLVRPAV